MPHGHADFGLDTAKETIHAVTDLGELAARLRSINTYDRRGDVVWFDDFESSLNKWMDRSGDLGHAIAISNAHARNGAFSCIVTCGSNGNFEGILSTSKPPPVRSKIGVEVHFRPPVLFFTSLTVRALVTHADRRWDARIRYVHATGTLQYWDGAAYQDIEAGVVARVGTLVFNPLKFVIDLDNDTYTRLMFALRNWDLSNYAVLAAAGAPATEIRIDITIVGAAGQNPATYTDDFILTQNEP